MRDFSRKIKAGDVITFITTVDKSAVGQDAQIVRLRVDKVNMKKRVITGINVERILDGTATELYEAFRSYKIDNIQPGTIYKLIG